MSTLVKLKVMKKVKILLAIIIVNMCLVSYSHDVLDVPPKIYDAMKVGNATELAKYFNSSVELVILDKEDIYSKQQAEQIVKSFFEKNKVKSFSLLHQGGKEGAKYAICNLENTAGKVYRVYFLIKETSGNPLIHQMRIEVE